MKYSNKISEEYKEEKKEKENKENKENKETNNIIKKKVQRKL